jgi:hypothetical protein
MDNEVAFLEHHTPECPGSWVFCGMGDEWCWCCSVCQIAHVESARVLRAVIREARFGKLVNQLAEEGKRLLQYGGG